MLLGAGLAQAWPHDKAHNFFAQARWQIDELGLAVARLVAAAAGATRRAADRGSR